MACNPHDRRVMTTELHPDDLYRRCDASTLPFDSTAEYTGALAIIGQDRAIEAARFALGMRHEGYNVFALGPKGVGKETIIRQLLAQEAPRQPTPPDLAYVFDFAQPHRAKALRLPPGTASRLRDDMQRAIAQLLVALPRALESEEHRTRKYRLVQALEHRQEAAFAALEHRANARGIGVVRTENGVDLAALRGGKMLESAEFEKLPASERAALDEAMQELGVEISSMFHDFDEWASAHEKALAMLDREIAEAAARAVVDDLRATYRDLAAVTDHLAALERDIADNADRFTDKHDSDVPEAIRRALDQRDDARERLRRYEVNVLIDHGKSCGAPIVIEENPTYANLFGRIEHASELGTLVTDFTLVRPGALHRANGGYLLLDAVKLLHQPVAWDALKRALHTRELRMESPSETPEVSTVSLEPEPVPLETKVILFGDRAVYYLLAALDPELEDLFKVMADFETSMDRAPDTAAEYARVIAALVHQDSLRPFDRGAVARVIEQSSRLAGDAHKLSIHLRSIGDLLREASDHARRAGHDCATAADVEAAISAQRRRAGRLQERTLEAIRRQTLLVATRGEAVGQINGLSVVELGHHAFAYPTRITARARVGEGELVDIEREAELGGPVHSKGVMILAGLIGARYGEHTPLSLSASIVFEQSYAGVEGDSASLAELCVLLSAIGDVPIRQGYAVTGSINQHGAIQAIGAVNEKIEGFFDACREQGLTGDQGVIIPESNVQHLMVRSDVIAAVAEGRFHIHAACDLDDALAVLTGLPAETVHRLVEARLRTFSEDERRYQLATPLHEKWHRHAG